MLFGQKYPQIANVAQFRRVCREKKSRILGRCQEHSVASWTVPVKDRKSEGLSDLSRESKEGVRKNIKIFTLNCRYFPKFLMVLIYQYVLFILPRNCFFYHEGVDGTVGRTIWANCQTFLLFSLFRILTYKNLMYCKLNLRPCGTHRGIQLTQLYLKNMWTHS